MNSLHLNSLRGAVLLPQVNATTQFLPYAEISWENQRILEIRELPRPRGPVPVLLPAFVDLHCHWPQAEVRGQFSGQLLPWLRESIWPTEAELIDPQRAEHAIQSFLRQIVQAGTGAGLFFGTPFAETTPLFLQHTPRGFLEGPAIMTQNAPETLLRDLGTTLDQLQEVEPRLRDRVSIAPRFAPNLSTADLHTCGEVARQNHWAIQSHLSENTDELAWVQQLFPEAENYTDVYQRTGLLGPQTVMAHGIHLTDRELTVLATTQTLIAHCPTSNEALGSGRMPLERLRQAEVPWVLATDVGAGPLLSQLHVMQTFLRIHAGHVSVTASEALARATAIPGAWLGQFSSDLNNLGTQLPGAPAHIVQLPPLALDEDRHAETVLQRILGLPSTDFERLPERVVLWGELLV